MTTDRPGSPAPAGGFPPEHPVPSFPGWSVAAAALVAVVHGAWVVRGEVSEDAFIFFRYARNTLRGDLLAWNPGGPPVEGFTSPLHLAALVLSGAFGADLVVAGQLLSMLGALAAVAATGWLAFELSGGRRRVAVGGALLLALSPQLAFWSLGALEGPLFSALLAAGLAAWIRERRRGGGRPFSPWILVAACLARPEAGAAIAVGAGVDAAGARGDGWGGPLRAVARWWPAVAAAILVTLGRLALFGAFLPNTWYAKSGGGEMALLEGLRYLRTFVVEAGPGLFALALVPAIGPRGDARRTAPRALLLLAALLATHVVLVGGDYQAFSRYLLPLLPLLAALAVAGLDRVAAVLAARSASLRRWGVALLAALLLAGPLKTTAEWVARHPLRPLPRPLATSASYRGEFAEMGRLLARVVAPGEVLAAMPVGAIGWYCDCAILDLFGLNDPAIARRPVDPRHGRFIPAHMKGSADEVLARRPDWLLPTWRPQPRRGPLAPVGEQVHLPWLADLLASPAFAAAYRLEPREMPDGGGWLNLYRRRERPVPEPGMGDDLRRAAGAR